VHWSKSRHTDHEECPRRFFFSEIAAQMNGQIAELANETTPPLVRHEVVRLAICEVVQTPGWKATQLPKLLKKAEAQLTQQIPNEYDVAAQFSIVEACLENFVGELLPEIRTAKVLYLAGGSPVEFIYDGLNISTLVELALDKGDSIEICNWKTGNSGWHKTDDQNLRAASLTCWARRVLKAVARPIIVSDVYLKEGPSPITRYQVQLDDDQIRDFVIQAKTVTQRYSASAKISYFPARPGFKTCRFCPFKPVCAEYRAFAEPDYELETLEASLAAAEQEKEEVLSSVGGELRPVFLSHVSGDKEAVVRPFARALEAEGIDFWLDEAELKWGDSLTSRINKGLAISEYLVCFVSEQFVQREWSQAEFGAAFSAQMSDGVKRVLPIVIGDKQKILDAYPMLRNTVYKTWTDASGIPALIRDLKKMLSDAAS
jgi:hypothetical protein